jgi:hypothetical protein
VPGPRGPTTGGPAGPATGGPRGGAGGPAGAPPAADKLRRLGSTRLGAEAVNESLATDSDDFYLGEKRKAAEAKEEGAAMVRRAAGRVFLSIGGELVEQGLPADWMQQVVAVEAYSSTWFELAKRKELREVLALGDRIVFRDGTRIVQVKPASTPAEAGK